MNLFLAILFNRDQNGDDVIDDDDRVVLGSYFPKFYVQCQRGLEL